MPKRKRPSLEPLNTASTNSATKQTKQQTGWICAINDLKSSDSKKI
jgi:hypothetical protein